MKTPQFPRIVLFYACAALIFLGLSFFVNESLDITYNEVYIVIAYAHILIILALLFALFSLIVWAMLRLKKRVSTLLNWAHFYITLIAVFFFWFLTQIKTSQTERYYDYSVYNDFQNTNKNSELIDWLLLVFGLLVFAQIIFIFNVLRAFILKNK